MLLGLVLLAETSLSGMNLAVSAGLLLLFRHGLVHWVEISKILVEHIHDLRLNNLIGSLLHRRLHVNWVLGQDIVAVWGLVPLLELGVLLVHLLIR